MVQRDTRITIKFARTRWAPASPLGVLTHSGLPLVTAVSEFCPPIRFKKRDCKLGLVPINVQLPEKMSKSYRSKVMRYLEGVTIFCHLQRKDTVNMIHCGKENTIADTKYDKAMMRSRC